MRGSIKIIQQVVDKISGEPYENLEAQRLFSLQRVE
jgi:NADH:ubiquinone oxidoreductase subunit D